jgi:hypothetical protein
MTNQQPSYQAFTVAIKCPRTGEDSGSDKRASDNRKPAQIKATEMKSVPVE